MTLDPPLAVHLPDDADLGDALAGFKHALALAPVPVLLTEPELDAPGPRITFANRAAGELTGYAPAELVGHTPRLFQGPLTDRGVLGRLRADLRAGLPFAGVVVNYKKDGTPYPLRWNVVPVTHRGRVVRFVSHQAADDPPGDPAAAALAERARLAEERFELAVTGCGLGFFDAALGTGRTYFSPGWKAHLGYADADLPNADAVFWDRLHPADRRRVRTAVDRLVAGADPDYAVEFRLRHRGGRWVWVEARGAGVRDAAGRVVRLVGTHTDVTARKEAEAAVRTSEERQRALLEAARDVVLVVAPDGDVRFVSGACRRLVGYAPEELAGRPAFEHAHPDDVPAVRAALAAAVARPGTEQRVEFRYRAAAGHTVRLEAYWVDLRANPAVGGVLVSARDITDRRRLEDQVRQAQKLEALGLMSGGVAHDFNNTLAVVLGALDLLTPPAAPADQELLARVRAAAGRARGLTDALLGFARRRDGEAPRPADLRPLLAATADVLRRVLGPGVAVAVDLPADLSPAVCDPGAVEQAVLNLAFNARDAMPGGGTLTLSAGVAMVPDPPPHPDERPGRWVVVSVADTGAGMPPEVRDRAFEPFFTTKPAGKGTGLGLATVADTARRAGGWVRLESEPGRGTRVGLALPAADPVPAPAPPPAASGRRVLVVDDEEVIRKLVAAVLGRAGYVVDQAADGPAGLAAYHARRPALVLLDLTLPGRPGQQVLGDLLAADPAARVLVVSGLLPAGVPAGAVGTLAKPFTQARLLAAVERALAGPDDPASGGR